MNTDGTDVRRVPDGDVDFGAIFQRIWRGRLTVFLSASFALLLGVVFMHVVTPKFMAEIRITANNEASNSTTGRLGSLGSIAALAGVSIGGGGESASPYQLYLEHLTSRQLADELIGDERIVASVFADEWDSSTKSWHRPLGFIPDGIWFLKRILGSDDSWRAPDGDRLQKYLSEELEIVVPGAKDAPITTVRFSNRDAIFAKYLLDRVNEVSDASLRAQALERTQGYIAHITKRLENTSVVEHRKALADALLDQEQSLMMANSSLPYSVLVVDGPAVSTKAAWPKLTQVVVSSLVLGAMAGVLLALLGIQFTLPKTGR